MTVTGILAASSMLVLFVDKLVKSIKDFGKSASDVKEIVK